MVRMLGIKAAVAKFGVILWCRFGVILWFYGASLQKGNLHSCPCHTTPDKGAENQKQMRLNPMQCSTYLRL